MKISINSYTDHLSASTNTTGVVQKVSQMSVVRLTTIIYRHLRILFFDE